MVSIRGGIEGGKLARCIWITQDGSTVAELPPFIRQQPTDEPAIQSRLVLHVRLSPLALTSHLRLEISILLNNPSLTFDRCYLTLRISHTASYLGRNVRT